MESDLKLLNDKILDTISNYNNHIEKLNIIMKYKYEISNIKNKLISAYKLESINEEIIYLEIKIEYYKMVYLELLNL